MVFYSSPNIGPKVSPGKYRIRLNYNGQIMESTLTVKGDPRLPNSESDYQAQEDFLIRVRDEVSKANEAIIRIRKIKKDIQYVLGKVAKNSQLTNALKEFEDQLSIVENTIHMTKNQSVQDPINYGIRINNRMAFLLADSQRGDYPPTDQALAFFEEIKVELQLALEKLEAIINSNMSQINDRIQYLGIPMIGEISD
jgi:predicted adenine nucleotide alpha hydrolase (AANH) superfamily ATPase